MNRPMPEVIISERGVPVCGDMKCDITENPSHWIDVELEEPYKSGPQLLDACKIALQFRLQDHGDDDNCVIILRLAITSATPLTKGSTPTILRKSGKSDGKE